MKNETEIPSPIPANNSYLSIIKNSWQIWIPIILSLTALIVSLSANHIAKKANEIYKEELRLTHRPYLWAENFGYLNKDDILINDPYTIKLTVINSPAKLISEVHSMYMIKATQKIEINNLSNNSRILYPSDKMQYTTTLGKESENKINQLIAEGFELYRESKIKYQMLSGNNSYIFDAKWKFDELNKIWNLEKSPEAN